MILFRALGTLGPRWTVLTSCLFGLVPVQAAVFTVGPSGDTACTHHVIQSAVLAAAQAPGADIVQITAGHWSGQAIQTADSADLHIEGGYQSCSQLIRVGISTLSGAGASGPVISHSGSGKLTLRNLVLRDGNATHGGGVRSAGAAALTLSNVGLWSNQAQVGGGLHVEVPDGARKPVLLVGTTFIANTGGAGGGLYARNADITISGDLETYFIGNQAQSHGGAINALNTNITATRVLPATGLPFMGGNQAGGNGGAVYFIAQRPGPHSLFLGNQRATRPLLLINNTAGQWGGALYVETFANGGASSSAGVVMTNANLVMNSAVDGGALWIRGTGTTHAGSASVTMLQSVAGSANPPCPQVGTCNVVANNSASGGAVLRLAQAGSLGSASLFLDRAHVRENESPAGPLINGGGSVTLYNSLVADNLIGPFPVVQQLPFSGNGQIRVANSTMAGNAISHNRLLVSDASPGEINVSNSLLFQPGQQLYQLGPGVTGSVINLMLGNVSGVPTGNNVVSVSDPRFIAAASGNYRLRSDSPAIDRWGATPTNSPPPVDLDGGRRPYTLAPTNTPHDFGAFEFGARPDRVFAGDFQQP